MPDEKINEKYKRPSWDEYFMEICHVVAKRSKDPNTKNGAVLVNDKKVIVGMGYNGFPRGVDDDQLTWKREGDFCDTKYAYVVHAEENAVYNANAKTDGCTLYCTLFPCNECVKSIIQCGVKEIVYESDKYHDQDIWKAARKLLDLAGIRYRQLTLENDEQIEPSKEKSEKLKIKKLSPDAKIPNFAREGDAGLDLYSMDSIAIPAGSRAGIQTGIALEIPEGKAGLIWDRAGLSSKQGLKVLGGVIDSGYRGEIIVTLANISREPVELPKGSKIAQIIIQPFEKPEIEIADELSESERGENGFGSSDILEQEEPIVEDDYDILDEELNEEMGEDGKSRW